MNPISGIQNQALQNLVQQGQGVGGSTPSTNVGGSDDFGKQLMDVLKEVNGSQTKASELGTDMMTGRRKVDYHDLMIAMEKASVALQLTVSVRDKLLEAYQTVSQTQI